jgi:hypothetical protein
VFESVGGGREKTRGGEEQWNKRHDALVLSRKAKAPTMTGKNDSEAPFTYRSTRFQHSSWYLPECCRSFLGCWFRFHEA